MSQFAESLKMLRSQLNLSMQVLADKAGISKSMISKIERDEVQPTLDVAGRLAKALGKTLSELLHPSQEPQMTFIPYNEQAIWKDASGIIRRNISPVFEGLKIEWLDVDIPAGTSIQKCATGNNNCHAKYILVKSGQLTIKVNDREFVINKGDSFYFDANTAHVFQNNTQDNVSFYIVIKHPN